MVSNIQEKSISLVDGILQRAIDASYRNARPVSSGLALRFGLQEIARRAYSVWSLPACIAMVASRHRGK